MNARTYVLDGETPVPEPDICKWGDWFQNHRRPVQQDDIGDTRVSTVFLGVDHSWQDGPPVLFETMIFGGDRDQECHRYHTWEEAEAGHRQVLESFRGME